MWGARFFVYPAPEGSPLLRDRRRIGEPMHSGMRSAEKSVFSGKPAGSAFVHVPLPEGVRSFYGCADGKMRIRAGREAARGAEIQNRTYTLNRAQAE